MDVTRSWASPWHTLIAARTAVRHNSVSALTHMSERTNHQTTEYAFPFGESGSYPGDLYRQNVLSNFHIVQSAIVAVVSLGNSFDSCCKRHCHWVFLYFEMQCQYGNCLSRLHVSFWFIYVMKLSTFSLNVYVPFVVTLSSHFCF